MKREGKYCVRVSREFVESHVDFLLVNFMYHKTNGITSGQITQALNGMYKLNLEEQEIEKRVLGLIEDGLVTRAFTHPKNPKVKQKIKYYPTANLI